MALLNWLFGHAFGWGVIAVLIAGGVLCVVMYRAVIYPRIQPLAVTNDEAKRVLAGYWVALYMNALCCLVLAVAGVIYRLTH